MKVPFGQEYVELDPLAAHAAEVIRDTYGDEVFVKPKNLLKFGRNDDVDSTGEHTIMQLQGSEVAETYPTTNAIDSVVSSDDGDDQQVTIEGHYLDADGNLVFHIQTATLEGNTEVTLSQPLARATRIYNSDSTEFAGTVYVYNTTDNTVTAGVPQTDSKIHIVAEAGEQQSLKAATAFSNQDYGLITEIYGAVNKKTAGVVDIRLKVREQGGVFRTQYVSSIATTGQNFFSLEFKPYLIIPKNADIIMTATSSADNVSVSAGFNAFLAKVYNP